MSSSFDFSQWPPNLSNDELQQLQLRATCYALAHGLLYLPPGTQPAIPTSAIHAPISLFPAPFPRQLFEQAKRLQSIYNVLYARVALDTQFLDEVMGTETGVGKVDDFVGKLWTGWKDLRNQGLEQPLHLGLFRSDYLLHSANKETTLKQVEFNTISSSFGPLSQRVSELHRHLYASTRYFDSSSFLTPANFPANETTTGLAEGLAAAHKAYNVPGSRILFVVQPGERNVFDQLWLEYELIERHQIAVIRLTLDELNSRASVESVNAPLFILPAPSSASSSSAASGFTTSSTSEPSSSRPIEISTIYFRSTYTPTDFPTPAHFETRFTLEKSRAIICPSIPLQLAGGKKVQEVLTREGVVERFLGADYSKEAIHELKESWMGMWGLDVYPLPSSSSLSGNDESTSVFNNLVLKPQREGGGNNVYKSDIPPFLARLPEDEKPAWIVMEMIETPKDVGGYLVRSGGGDELVRAEVVSELGMFGWALFGEGVKALDGNKGNVIEKEAGWLVRTKGKESNEGGVATGFSVLDSVVLVD
ncbi:hypothetical protein D9758_013639 [Tetrapyrgos nigripes]|uniref:Glutathione synthetase n=1 Tax=Tetrapyrgos nigripes TaxID=182062 RepID=A0A8H5FQU5_9AGAR|nr:hypothetical protein D9758_013639 [Tetrapyrgos nigripes]